MYDTNVVNLMDSIRKVLESSKRAHALPHNSTISAGLHPPSVAVLKQKSKNNYNIIIMIIPGSQCKLNSVI